MLKVLLFAVLITSLSGCSSIRFFELQSEEAVITQQQNVELVSFKSKPTAIVHNHCLSVNRTTDVGNALLAHCSKELLSRNDLSLSLKKYALSSYSSSILKLIKLNQNVDSKVQINIEGNLDFLVVKNIIAKEKELSPVVFGELGVAIVVRQNNNQKGLGKYYPAEGIYSPRTLIIENIDFDGLRLKIQLSTKEQDYLLLGKNSYQLKRSPSAAFLALIENANIDDFSWLGFTNASQAEKRRGIFSIGAFSKTKPPIIMIHGLNSDPLIWRNLTMAMLNDEQIYKNFQIWHVYYPSGPPPFYNAMRIRKQLREFINQLNAPTLYSKAVIVGHSMGGVISRTLSTESGDRLWDITFTDSYEKMKLKEDSPINNIFIFNPIFDKTTVFFLDTPHRGSSVANSVIGSIGSAFVTLPNNFKNIFKRFIDTVGIEKITRVMQPFLIQHGPNSVQVLRPGHPLMEALIDLPVSGESYSIIGSTTKLTCKTKEDCNDVSDGVVDYSSAYIESSVDTVIVKSSHNSFKSPDAISFILGKLKRKVN